MRTLILLLVVILLGGCRMQPPKLNENSHLDSIVKDKYLAKQIEIYLDKNNTRDSTYRSKGYSIASKYYYLFTQDTCKNLRFLIIMRLPFIESEVFQPNKYLGYYTYNNQILIFTKVSDSVLTNISYLNKSIPKNIPDENSIEGLTRGDYAFLAYLLNNDGSCCLVCQNPVDFLEPLSNDTAYFGCF